jgi:mannose-6-phosphate isomerase
MKPAPLTFTPLFMERVWGGRGLQEAFGKPLPDGAPIGESWEVVDRPEAQSVVASGPLAGVELHQLWREDRERIFGARAAGAGDRFPILVKLLDARETLSVQVHPPAHLAEELDGEPKNELWYVAGAAPGANLFAGLRRGVSQDEFSAALKAGEDVSAMLHRIEVQIGDALFIPAGRVHAIGAGCLVVEIQQSSDTTYRVFDFNRPGLDGKPRELHLPQSLASIDFSDLEPALRPPGDGLVLANENFTVTRRRIESAAEQVTTEGECAIVCVLTGETRCGNERFGSGSFFLVPADTGSALPVSGPAEVLIIELP